MDGNERLTGCSERMECSVFLVGSNDRPGLTQQVSVGRGGLCGRCNIIIDCCLKLGRCYGKHTTLPALGTVGVLENADPQRYWIT